MAIKRAQIENIPVFLGSATPSLQTLKLIKERKFKKFDLLRRVDGKKPPKLIPLDISDSPLIGGIAIQTMSIIEAAISKGEQVLIFSIEEVLLHCMNVIIVAGLQNVHHANQI